MASLSDSGLVPMSAAIAGSEVAITVESMFSMNRATATISGTMRLESMEIWSPFDCCRTVTEMGPALATRAHQPLRRGERFLNDNRVTVPRGALAVMVVPTGEDFDDLHPCGIPAADRAAHQRAAAVGAAQSYHHHPVHHLRAGVLGAVPGPVAPRGDCRPYEAGEPQAPRDRRGDRAPRPAAGLRPLTARDQPPLSS